MKSFKSLREQRDNEMEKAEMAEQQLHFICYAVDEILEYIQEGGEIEEEWYQNKLSKVHSDVEGLYSYVQGEKHRMKNDDEDDDDDMMPGMYR